VYICCAFVDSFRLFPTHILLLTRNFFSTPIIIYCIHVQLSLLSSLPVFFINSSVRLFDFNYFSDPFHRNNIKNNNFHYNTLKLIFILTLNVSAISNNIRDFVSIYSIIITTLKTEIFCLLRLLGINENHNLKLI
jgi:hypothetical protein